MTDQWRIRRTSPDQVQVTHSWYDAVNNETHETQSVYAKQGAYVYRQFDNGTQAQACRGLLSTGSTLMHYGQDLATVVAQTLRHHRTGSVHIEGETP